MPDKHEVGGSSPLGPTRRESVKAFTARYSREADKLQKRRVTRVKKPTRRESVKAFKTRYSREADKL